MSIKFTSVPKKSLARAILSTDVAFNMNNILGWNRVDLTPSNFGTQAFGVFFNSRFDEIELFEWDPATVAANSISFVGRGLDFTGDYTVVPANKKDWPAGTIVQVGSDIPQLIADLKQLLDLDTNTGLVANSDSKIASQKATKAYYAALIFGTIADSSVATKGKARISAAPASATNPIVLGDNDPRVPTQDENNAMAGTFGTPGTGNKFVTEDDAGLTNNMDLESSESVAGVKTFLAIPISALGPPTSANELATKGYVDSK